MAERNMFDLDVTRNHEFAMQGQRDATGPEVFTITSIAITVMTWYMTITYFATCIERD